MTIVWVVVGNCAEISFSDCRTAVCSQFNGVRSACMSEAIVALNVWSFISVSLFPLDSAQSSPESSPHKTHHSPVLTESKCQNQCHHVFACKSVDKYSFISPVITFCNLALSLRTIAYNLSVAN